MTARAGIGAGVRGDLYGTPGERLGLRPLLRAATALATPNTTTVRDVEIVQTGIEYPLSTGPTTFTVEDLSDLVESQDDPAIQTPRLKMGHFANLGLLEDGQPAVGTVGNLRLEQEGHLVVGDYIGIPTWLAEILPSAYPARSIEAAQGVTTNTGHNWRLVLTDLALLGVVWPGVGTLEDIQALYSEEGPDNIRILTTKEEVDQTMARAARGVTAQVDTEVVRRSYYDDLGADQFWWWIRSMLVDPSELIVEDEESGDLYRVPYEIKGDEVTFGDPVAVKIVYKDKPSSQQPGNTEAAWEVPALPKGSTVAVYANRAESRPEQEGSDVTIASEVDPVALRTSLGLAEDASDDEVRTQLAAAGFVAPPGHEVPGASTTAPGSEVPGTSATAEHVPGGPDNTATSGPTDPAEAAPVTTPPTGTVTVDAAVWQDTRRQAQQGATAFQRLEGQDRDGAIAAAIQEGRIPPSRKTHWEQSWERDPEGTRTLLTAAEDKGGLAKGLIPVKATGQSGPLEDTTVEAYPASWLPEVKRGE